MFKLVSKVREFLIGKYEAAMRDWGLERPGK